MLPLPRPAISWPLESTMRHRTGDSRNGDALSMVLTHTPCATSHSLMSPSSEPEARSPLVRRARQLTVPSCPLRFFMHFPLGKSQILITFLVALDESVAMMVGLKKTMQVLEPSGCIMVLLQALVSSASGFQVLIV